MGSILWAPTPSSLPSAAQAQNRLFSQVPSDVTFHFPAPRVLFPSCATALFSSLPGSLCPVKWFLHLPSSFRSTSPPQPGDKHLEPRSRCPAPTQVVSPWSFSGTNFHRRGLGAQPPPRWCPPGLSRGLNFGGEVSVPRPHPGVPPGSLSGTNFWS